MREVMHIFTSLFPFFGTNVTQARSLSFAELFQRVKFSLLCR